VYHGVVTNAATLLGQLMALPPEEREALALHVLTSMAPFVSLDDKGHWDNVLARREADMDSAPHVVDAIEQVTAAARAAIDARH
jgi:hypothetical protein